MNILIINGGPFEQGPSRDVADMGNELKKKWGEEQVTVLNYRAMNSDARLDRGAFFTSNFIIPLQLKAGQYFDFVFISGGHSYIRKHGDGVDCYVSNSLCSYDFRELMHVIEGNNIRFGHVIFGSCYSTFYQNDIIPLLHPEVSSLLSIPMLCTDKMIPLFLDLVEGRPVSLEHATLQGFKTVLRELEGTTDLSDDEHQLLLEGRGLLSYQTISDELQKMVDLFEQWESLTSESIEERLQLSMVILSSLHTTSESAVIMEKLLPYLSGLLEGLQLGILESSSGDFDSKRSEFIAMRHEFEAVYSKTLVSFVKDHYEQCERGGFRLASAIESPIVFFHKKTLFVRTCSLIALPKTVLLACDDSDDIADQLYYYNFLMKASEKRMSLQELGSVFNLADHYRSITSQKKAEPHASMSVGCAGSGVSDIGLFSVKPADEEETSSRVELADKSSAHK